MGFTKDLRRSALVVLAAGALALAAATWGVVRAPAEPVASPLVVNDVTQLDPIPVSGVITPTTTQAEARSFGRTPARSRCELWLPRV